MSEKKYDGQYEVNELPVGLVDVPPYLLVNGVTVYPLADDTTDIVISFPSGNQSWELLKEYTPWEDVNRFGYYIDPGFGLDRALIFSGRHSQGYGITTAIPEGQPLGLWLHNDINGDSTVNGDDSHLFSERDLSIGSWAHEHQWFMIYDLSVYKYAGASYNFITPTEDFAFTGDYDYLIFIDDDHTSANFDHNDMIAAITCNRPPEVACHGDTSVFLCGLQPVSIPDFSCYDPDGNLLSCSVNVGTLDGGTVTFTPSAPGITQIRLIAIDTWGAADTCFTDVTVNINSRPDAVSPPDQNMFVCDLSEICLPGFTATDVDNNIVSRIVLGGTLNGETACFVPVEGDNTLTFIVTDACGAADTSVTVVTVDLNQAPSASSPPNQNLFVCDLSELCIPGFVASDADYNIVSKIILDGSMHGDTACFIPVEGDNTLTFIVTDACGAADTSVTVVTVNLNQAPSASSPPNQNMFVCDLSEICLPGFTATDLDNNIVSRVVLGAVLNGETACFTPVVGPNTLTFIVTDACGAADTSVTVVTVTLNAPPVATSPANQEMFVCTLDQVCLPGFIAADVDNNIVSRIVLGGSLDGETVCFTPIVGANSLTFMVTDACGAADTSITVVMITLNQAPQAIAPADTALLAPDLSPICLPGFTASDIDGNLMSKIVLGGTLSGDTVCFTPIQGINTLTLVAVDSCGAVDTAVTHVTVNIGISLALIGAPPVFTEEVTDTFLVAIAGGDPGSMSFATDFIDHAGTPARYNTSYISPNFEVIVTFDLLGEFSSAQSPFAFRVIASDAYSADTLDLSLVVNDYNRSPSISAISDTTIDAGTTLAFGVTGNDLDSDNTLTLAKASGPGNFGSVPGPPPVSGTFSWATGFGDVGTHQVVFMVDDGRGGSAADTVNITVFSNGIELIVIGGEPPVFTEEVPDSFRVSLGDYDPGSLTFSTDFVAHAGSPARYSADLTGGVIRIISTFDYLGEFSNAQSPFAFRVIASDNFSADTLDLSLLVNDNNRAPSISVGSNYTVIVDHPLNFMVTGEDLDSDNILGLVKVSGPGNFAGASGPPPVSDIFSWTPTDADVPGSPYTVRFAVGDGRGGVDSADVTITVYPEGVPILSLVYTPSIFNEGRLDSIVFTGADPEGDAMLGYGYKFLSPDSSFGGASFAVRNDTAYLRLNFEYVGAWSSSNTPFPLRLMGYSTIADYDSVYLNIDLTVVNANRKPELQMTGPHLVEAGDVVNLSLATADPDMDDIITLTGAGLPPGSVLTDFGNGSGSFNWTTTLGDIGMYGLSFFTNDNRGQSNSMDTVFWALQVTSPDTGGPDEISLDMGCPSTVPGANVPVPVYLHTPDFYTGGFEVLIGWDPTVLTLTSVTPTARIHDGDEYFNVHYDDSGPGTARMVWLADVNDGNYGPPMEPGNGTIMWLNFHVAPGEFLWGMMIPIDFLVRHWSDNTISDSTGYILEWPLLSSGCVFIEDPSWYAGDPNMNCQVYEIADAVLVAQRLIQGYIVWAADDLMPNPIDDPDTPEDESCNRHAIGNDPAQEVASDLNGNGFVDVADLVMFINIINGFIFPKLDPIAGSAAFTMPDQAAPSVDVMANSDVELGAVLVKIGHGNVEIGEPVASNGMDVIAHDANGVMSVLVFSFAGNRIPSGVQALFTLPMTGDGALTFVEVQASDCIGQLVEVTSRLDALLPLETGLGHNYPNPFNPGTTFELALAHAGAVQFDVYDISGRRVRMLVSGVLQAGYYDIRWDGRNDDGAEVASGVYFARLTADGYVKTVKMSLLR